MNSIACRGLGRGDKKRPYSWKQPLSLSCEMEELKVQVLSLAVVAAVKSLLWRSF